MFDEGFCKFTSIESLAHVWKYHSMRFETPTVRYGRKIKLHGTNGGVRIESDGAIGDPITVIAQSRSRSITVEKDNAGFAKWVGENMDAFARSVRGQPVTIFGEWAGLGIQRAHAVTMLKDKFFFVFAAQLGDYMITSPKVLEDLVPDLDNLLVLPWVDDAVYTIDFGDADAARVFAEMASADAESVGELDPFIEEIFGIAAPGEGHVYMPINSMLRDDFSSVTFKVKAAKDRVKNTEKGATIKMEIPENVQAFVKAFVTDARGEQAVTEACGGVYEKRFMSKYMKWMGQDIKKESVAELADMDMKWKDVTSPLNANVARWYLKRCEVIV